jgi:hypothetical protein
MELQTPVEKQAAMEKSARYRPAMLFALVVCIPLVLTLAAFPIVTSQFFQEYCDKPDIQRMTWPYLHFHRQCDVVIYGDSTAEVGLDPVQISQQTHLTTCNIAVTFPAVAILGVEPLEKFLSTSHRPQYLVLSFAAGNFVPPSPSHGGLAWDGLILAARLGEWKPVMRAITGDPDRVFAVINYAYLGGSLGLVKSILRHHGMQAPQGEDGTHFSMPVGPLMSCVPSRAANFIPDQAYIDVLRSRLAGRADHVILNVSPASTCLNMFSRWQAALAPTTANGLAEYPLHLFADDYYHLTSDGAAKYSETVAAQVLKLKAESTSVSSQVK